MPLKDLQDFLQKHGKIKQVSDITGVSQKQLVLIKKGKVVPNPSTLVNIAVKLGLDPDAFLDPQPNVKVAHTHRTILLRVDFPSDLKEDDVEVLRQHAEALVKNLVILAESMASKYGSSSAGKKDKD